MNTYLITFDILFNNALIGRGVSEVNSKSALLGLEDIKNDEGAKLLKQINEQQVKKGESVFSMKSILIAPTCIHQEK